MGHSHRSSVIAHQSLVTRHSSPVSGQLISRSAAAGFTLLELIVAFAILGLMSMIIFSAFRMAINSYVKSQERLEEKARERVLLDHIKRQIGSLFPLRPTAAFMLEQGRGPAQYTPESFMRSQAPLFYGMQESVTFITVAPLLFQENPGLTVVRYGHAKDQRGRFYMGSMETPFHGLDSFKSMVRVPKGKPLPLIEHISRVSFEYYGYDQRTQTYQWFDEWSGENMHAVPNAIRINYDGRQLTVPVNATFLGGTFAGGGIQGLIQR